MARSLCRNDWSPYPGTDRGRRKADRVGDGRKRKALRASGRKSHRGVTADRRVCAGGPDGTPTRADSPCHGAGTQGVAVSRAAFVENLEIAVRVLSAPLRAKA